MQKTQIVVLLVSALILTSPAESQEPIERITLAKSINTLEINILAKECVVSVHNSNPTISDLRQISVVMYCGDGPIEGQDTIHGIDEDSDGNWDHMSICDFSDNTLGFENQDDCVSFVFDNEDWEYLEPESFVPDSILENSLKALDEAVSWIRRGSR